MKIVTVSDPETGAATRPGITMCPPPDLRKEMVVHFGDWEQVIEDAELKLAILTLPHSFRALDTWNKRHPEGAGHRDQHGNLIEDYHVCGCRP